MQIPDINLDAIPDPAMRQFVGQLRNLIEALVAENTALRAEVQQLRDENARLKGASAKPEIKPPVPPAPSDHSSEDERRTRTPRGKPKKNATLTVTREQRGNAMSVSAPNHGLARMRGTPSKHSRPPPPNVACGCIAISVIAACIRPPPRRSRITSRSDPALRHTPRPDPAVLESMAARLGTVREMVGRSLKTFEQLGFVSVTRGTLSLTDRAGLEDQAEQ